MELVDRIITLHKSMHETLRKHGVPEAHLCFKTVNLTDSTERELMDCLAWLMAHEKNEYKALVDAWKLVTPETWAFYDQTETTGLQEQVILEKAAKRCKRAWLDRPFILQTKFNRKKATDEQNGKAPTAARKRTKGGKGRP